MVRGFLVRLAVLCFRRTQTPRSRLTSAAVTRATSDGRQPLSCIASTKRRNGSSRNCCEDFTPLLASHTATAGGDGFAGQLLDRVGRQDALAIGPAEGSLDGTDGTTPGGLPAGVG